MGTALCRPPSWEKLYVRRRSNTMPTSRNRAPVDSPWLTISTIPPVMPSVVNPNSPITMKPTPATVP